MEDIIKVEGVAKGYGKHQVLQNLDIAIKKGECFTLLGPSGCGKTVLIRLIAGHEVPDEGKIIIDETEQKSLFLIVKFLLYNFIYPPQCKEKYTKHTKSYRKIFS